MKHSILSKLRVAGCAIVAVWMPVALADNDPCLNGSADEKIQACTQAIEAGGLQPEELAIKYVSRGGGCPV